MEGAAHTWLGQRNQISHILHEYAALELQLGLALVIDKALLRQLILGLVDVNVLAAKKDRLEEVDVVLQSRLAWETIAPSVLALMLFVSRCVCCCCRCSF